MRGGGVTTTNLRVRTRYRVVTGVGRTGQAGILRETGEWVRGRTKKTAPFGVKMRVQVYFGARVRAGVRVRVRVFFTVSCFTLRVFLLADPSPQQRRALCGRFYSFIYCYTGFLLFFQQQQPPTGHAMWTFARQGCSQEFIEINFLP